MKNIRIDANMKKCAELLVMKDVHGMTNDDVARECGIDRSTLYRWKQQKDFNDYMLSVAEELQRSFLPDAYSALRTILLTGKNHERLKAIELTLKNQGRLKDVQESHTTIEAEVSVDDMLKSLGI